MRKSEFGCAYELMLALFFLLILAYRQMDSISAIFLKQQSIFMNTVFSVQRWYCNEPLGGNVDCHRRKGIQWVGEKNISLCIVPQTITHNKDCSFQQYFSYIVAASFIGGGNRSTWENHWHVPSHWQTLSPIVVSSSPHLSCMIGNWDQLQYVW